MPKPDVTHPEVRGEDDHDLLTFLESGERVREEIEAIEAELRENPSADRVAPAEARLRTLKDAQDRISRRAADSLRAACWNDAGPPARHRPYVL